ncbi:MAG: chemotaxis protein CheX [Acidobacteriaceae bacterium]|nr:chemotaxis protein CheX [Acidobacteriaceae bacterium]
MKTEKEIGTGKIPASWGPMLELALREVFEIMLACKLEPQDAPVSGASDFTAMVGLAGQLCGLLTLRCSARSATLMASRMLGTDVKEADQQIWDAIGEIANMVAGNFKNKLTGMGDRCVLSVPTVITGSDYSFHSMADTGPLEVILLFEGSPVTVAVEIHS